VVAVDRQKYIKTEEQIDGKEENQLDAIIIFY